MSASSARDCASLEFVSFLLSSLSLSLSLSPLFLTCPFVRLLGPSPPVPAPETTSARLSAADYDFAYKGRRGGGRSDRVTCVQKDCYFGYSVRRTFLLVMGCEI